MNFFKTLFIFFLVLFVGSTTLLVLVLFPLVTSEVGYQLDQVKWGKGMLRSWIMPQVTILAEPELDRSFGIWIEKININTVVFPNVDSTDPKQYKPVLMQGVAHARGTAFPGEGQGNVYLFAHSTDTTFNIVRYNAVFFLLRKLEPGDKVVIRYHGQRFEYRIVEKLITEATDTRFLAKGEGPEQLVLQTCWPPGTTWKRLLLLGKPV